MNIALEKTEEYVNGQLRRSYGDAFVRGNNGMPFRTRHGADFVKLTGGSALYFSAIIFKLFRSKKTIPTLASHLPPTRRVLDQV